MKILQSKEMCVQTRRQARVKVTECEPCTQTTHVNWEASEKEGGCMQSGSSNSGRPPNTNHVHKPHMQTMHANWEASKREGGSTHSGSSSGVSSGNNGNCSRGLSMRSSRAAAVTVAAATVATVVGAARAAEQQQECESRQFQSFHSVTL